jgi:hypothetical protein
MKCQRVVTRVKIIPTRRARIESLELCQYLLCLLTFLEAEGPKVTTLNIGRDYVHAV